MHDHHEPRPNILVTGGTGKTGRRVTRRLDALGIAHRVASRSGDPAFDWDRPHSWPAVLDGITAVYVAFAPDLTAPGAGSTIEAFLGTARSHGVERVVLLSGRGEPEAEACEAITRRSGMQWTIVRASWFCQNFSEDFLADAVMAGEIALPATDVLEPFVDAEDIADVAVAALTDPRHHGRTYDVTGPELLDFTSVAALLAQVTGHDVQFVPVTADEYAAGALANGVPAALVELLIGLFAGVLDGRNAHLGCGVREALGRAPRSFATYATDAAAAGAWARTSEEVRG